MDIKEFRKGSKEQSGKDGELGTKADPRDPCPALAKGAAPTPDPAIAGGPEIKSHSATKGLFAHIQSNNIKSIVVFIVFVFLIQVILIAVTIVAMPYDTANQTSNINSASTIRDPAGSGFNGFSSLNFDGKDRHDRVKQNQRNRPVLDVSFSDFENIWDYLFVQKKLYQGGALWIMGYSLLYIIGGIFSAAVFVRRQTGAHRVDKTDEPRLYAIIERLTITRGLPMPGVEIIEAQGRNAYASGFHPRNSAIGVSRGLLEALNDAELEAVLAHEVAHIEGRDNRLMTFANVTVGAISAIGRTVIDKAYEMPIQFFLVAFFSILIFPIINLVLFLILVMGAWAGAEAIRLLISQKREIIADARAIEIMKSPEALISALLKVSRNDEITGLNPDVQAMMISNLSGTNQATHPTITARIHAIEQTTSVNYADIRAMENIVSAPNGTARHKPWHTSRQKLDAAGTASYDERHKSTQQQSSESEQLIEDVNLDKIYKAYKRYEDGMTAITDPKNNFRFGTWMVIVFASLIIVSAISFVSWLSNMIGIPWQATIFMIIGGWFFWKYQHKFI